MPLDEPKALSLSLSDLRPFPSLPAAAAAAVLLTGVATVSRLGLPAFCARDSSDEEPFLPWMIDPFLLLLLLLVLLVLLVLVLLLLCCRSLLGVAVAVSLFARLPPYSPPLGCIPEAASTSCACARECAVCGGVCVRGLISQPLCPGKIPSRGETAAGDRGETAAGERGESHTSWELRR